MTARLANDRPDISPLPASPSFAVWANVRGCDGGTRCGDYVTYRLRSDGQLALVVVDMAGHGAGCRLPAYFLGTNLLGLLTLGSPLERAVALADRDFRVEFPGEVPTYASVFAGLIDPYQGRMRYVAAGGETAIILRDRTRGEVLAPTSSAFGLVADPRYAAATLALDDGDTLVVATGGVTEAQSASGVPFGAGGVLFSVARAMHLGDDPARAVVEDATRHGARTADDRAALAVTFTGRS
ncbi:MAG: PP2C family protein-serine/threonine phosphatase [Candidatus Lustribacter sp.]|jgi:serine phosphatase RsbU (regulator of sigma subunit)